MRIPGICFIILILVHLSHAQEDNCECDDEEFECNGHPYNTSDYTTCTEDSSYWIDETTCKYCISCIEVDSNYTYVCSCDGEQNCSVIAGSWSSVSWWVAAGLVIGSLTLIFVLVIIYHLVKAIKDDHELVMKQIHRNKQVSDKINDMKEEDQDKTPPVIHKIKIEQVELAPPKMNKNISKDSLKMSIGESNDDNNNNNRDRNISVNTNATVQVHSDNDNDNDNDTDEKKDRPWINGDNNNNILVNHLNKIKDKKATDVDKDLPNNEYHDDGNKDNDALNLQQYDSI